MPVGGAAVALRLPASPELGTSEMVSCGNCGAHGVNRQTCGEPGGNREGEEGAHYLTRASEKRARDVREAARRPARPPPVLVHTPPSLPRPGPRPHSGTVLLLRSAAERESAIAAAGDAAVVIVWFAPWCGMCEVYVPLIDRLAATYPEVVFAKANGDEGRLAMSSMTLASSSSRRPRFVIFFILARHHENSHLTPTHLSLTDSDPRRASCLQKAGLAATFPRARGAPSEPATSPGRHSGPSAL